MKVPNSFQLTQLGGDGAFMSPNLDQSSVIEIAVPDLCRSIKMFPSDYQTVGIMNGLKFEIVPNVYNLRCRREQALLANRQLPFNLRLVLQ